MSLSVFDDLARDVERRARVVGQAAMPHDVERHVGFDVVGDVQYWAARAAWARGRRRCWNSVSLAMTLL
jgi:hypothetical protein